MQRGLHHTTPSFLSLPQVVGTRTIRTGRRIQSHLGEMGMPRQVPHTTHQPLLRVTSKTALETITKAYQSQLQTVLETTHQKMSLLEGASCRILWITGVGLGD
jgi:hypothetical protein